MPRIPTSLLRKAHTIDGLLPSLLASCRNLNAALNELRWLRDHAAKLANARKDSGCAPNQFTRLKNFVLARAKGKPIQYILGTEYFGNIEIRCRPGVLIPRPDTAASVAYLVCSVRNASNLPAQLRVLDLCTGTGCIPLLFHHDFHAARKDVDLHLLGVDISDEAINLAKENLKIFHKTSPNVGKALVSFVKADILADTLPNTTHETLSLTSALRHLNQPQTWDILISNPPYISPSAYWKTTSRSVRVFEPKLALVPPSPGTEGDMEQGDRFYPRLLDVAINVQAKVVLLEVADLQQATRIAKMARAYGIWSGIQIWREQPSLSIGDGTIEGFNIIGEGNARSVICWRGAGASWLGKSA